MKDDSYNVARIFKSVVFGQKPEILLLPWLRHCCLCHRHSRTLTFCNISVITEDVYLKLKLCVHHPKSNPYCQGRQFKMHFYAPVWKDWGHIVLPSSVCLSVHQSLCLHKLNLKT